MIAKGGKWNREDRAAMFGETIELQDKVAMENLNKKLTLNEIPKWT